MSNEILFAIIELFLYFALGILAAATHFIKDDEIDKWSNFITKWIYPLYIFKTLVTGLNGNQLFQLWPLPLIGSGIMIVGAILGLATFWALKNKDEKLIRSYINISAMNNFAFLPIIIVERLWGSEGLAQFFIMLLGMYATYWTLGVLIYGGSGGIEIIKRIFNPTFVAILLGSAIKLSNLDRFIPELFITFSGKLSASSVPLILTLIGANLFYSIKRFKKENIWNLFYFTILRNIVFPAILILLLQLLPISQLMFKISLIVAVMPSSTMSTVLARIYNGDADFTAQSAVTTHLLSLVSVPLWLLALGF